MKDIKNTDMKPIFGLKNFSPISYVKNNVKIEKKEIIILDEKVENPNTR